MMGAINIVSADLLGGYRLRLVFDDGNEQTVDFKPFLSCSRHPDIRAYLDPARFACFRLEYGELVWGLRAVFPDNRFVSKSVAILLGF